ncbi:MAG: hypothetical protein U9Q85_02300 [Patescibacteria group bacterium]|nr:hypothetical protein [Patescibacteria group bacterium]
MPNRIITGGIIAVLSACLVFASFTGTAGIDYGTVITGVFFLLIGVFIIFNKKEDEIEKIKD